MAGLAPNLMAEAKVSASGNLTSRGVDSSATIQLNNDDGDAAMTGCLVMGAQGAATSSFYFIGDEGWLAVHYNLFNPDRAQISARSGVDEELVEPASSERYRWEIEEAGRGIREHGAKADW